MQAVVFHEPWARSAGHRPSRKSISRRRRRARCASKVVASGLCHSDIHRLHGHLPSATPMVMGHEGAGIVEEIGEAVTDLAPGDHVVISFGPYCGGCGACSDAGASATASARLRAVRLAAGAPTPSAATCWTAPAGSAEGRAADQPPVLGLLVRAGGRGARVERGEGARGRGAAEETIALLGCGATSGLAPVFNDAQVEAGSSVAVIGVGGLGLNTVQASALSGALTIIAIDLLEHRLDQAREFGATHAINAAEQDPIAEVRRISGGGVDYAFEVIGSAGDGAAGDPDGAVRAARRS